MFECEQCRVWGYERRFATLEAAEQHLLYVHPLRFHKLYQVMCGLAGVMFSDREEELMAAMKARRE